MTTLPDHSPSSLPSFQTPGTSLAVASLAGMAATCLAYGGLGPKSGELHLFELAAFAVAAIFAAASWLAVLHRAAWGLLLLAALTLLVAASAASVCVIVERCSPGDVAASDRHAAGTALIAFTAVYALVLALVAANDALLKFGALAKP